MILWRRVKTVQGNMSKRSLQNAKTAGPTLWGMCRFFKKKYSLLKLKSVASYHNTVNCLRFVKPEMKAPKRNAPEISVVALETSSQKLSKEMV